MAIPYPYVTNNANHINTGSYFDETETKMFVNGYGTELWYGFGETDYIELSVFDLDQNPLHWKTIHSEKQYKTVQMTYQDALDRAATYSYRELLTDFILYKNTKILVDPLVDLAPFGLADGSYLLSYNFVREMAGTPDFPLAVKEISPSRKEIKIIPVGANTVRYQAFCLKKFQIRDVAPLLLQLTNQCPYDQIYNRVKEKYASQTAFLKQLLFLTSDGALVAYLKTLYEDTIVYTNPSSGTQPVEKVKRVQGIRNYYQNLLLSNYESISDFIALDDAYDAFVVQRVNSQFQPYGAPNDPNFAAAKQFLVDFFTTEFYHPITLSSKAAFEEKYYSFFKNAMNLGNNVMFPIINHTYLDERTKESDPLTLVIKLKTELPDDVKLQTTCWITNISIAPFVINAILKTAAGQRTIKISPPNFTIQSDAISLYNRNESFTAASLRTGPDIQQKINVNKSLNELQVDYTNFTNFIVFSSAAQRLANFKTKISTWYMLSSSLETLENNQSQSLASGTVYPQYSIERASLQGQMSDIVGTFDGYESYLFQTGSYAYSPSTKTFLSASYVAEQDFTASLYDKTNRDSLLNNTPDHIVLDDSNNEYLMFINMVGHFFDNLYLYITNLPSEKVIENSSTKNFSKKMVDYMLETFGWKIGADYEDLTSEEVYTTGSSLMTAEDRTRAIRSRVLNSLPQIYKTKGTEESIKLLLSCYGIPSNLLDIREYGSNDYSTASLATYTKRERSCMLVFSSSFSPSWGYSTSPILTETFYPRPDLRTIEFKMLCQTPDKFEPRKKYFFANSDHTYTIRWDQGWSLHISRPDLVPLYTALGYYTFTTYPAWRIGVVREYGHMGRVVAELPMYSASFYSRGDIGTFTGIWSGSALTANGSVSANAFFSSSYFSGSVDGGPIVEISGSVSGSVNGVVTGSIKTFSTVYFTGALTGAIGQFIDGTFNKTGVFYGASSYLGKIGYQETPRVFLTSSLLPIFDGEIFNIRLRRNEPDPTYQYATDQELVPSVYDLTVQRNESGRKIFHSLDSKIGQHEDNMVWDGRSMMDIWETTGSLGTTVSQSITFGIPFSEHDETVYALGNIMTWDVPISDSDFEIHCNDFSSFAYSGSEAEKHLITRVDVDEPYWFYNTVDSYVYDSAPTGSDSGEDYVFGFASGKLQNKSEYYSTYQALYLTASSTRNGVALSGSWIGSKTGSLFTIERFTGSFKGYMSGSISGSGEGNFFSRSLITGMLSGSGTGSFGGEATGSISGVAARVRGFWGSGRWYGTLIDPNANYLTQSWFTGSFSGSVSGTFFGLTFGEMTSAQFGNFVGYKWGPWTGKLTGSLTGSVRSSYMTGTFNGYSSASQYDIQNVGNYVGTINQLWFGALSGSLTGSFSGSGHWKFSGSSPWQSYPWGNFGAQPFYGQVVFTGSMAGVMTSSVYDNTVPRDTYATGTFSGSFLQDWTGSPVLLYNKPITPVDISWDAYDAYIPLNYTTSYFIDFCGFRYEVLAPVYPYEFLVLDIEKTYTTPSYGPNRFKNEKVKPKLQSVASRLSNTERSTADLVRGVQSDSNLLGLYLDPQDAKNRDIVKFYGNNDIVELLADPSNMYSSSYTQLQDLNRLYNSFGDRRVLYNELITLYKIYFNRSIFDTIKNVIPARASIRAGIVVEPTVLERPKYQNRPIAPEMNTGSVVYFDVTASHYFRDPVTKLVRFSGSVGNVSSGHLGLLFGEFNWNTSYSQSAFNTGTLPANPTMHLDLSYLNEANFIRPVNYGGGYISDLSDEIQFGTFASVGTSAYPMGLSIVDGDTQLYMVKQWDKYTIYSKSGSHVRTSNRAEDVYTSSSIWLYKIVNMTKEGYGNFFYTSSKKELSGSVFDITINTEVEQIGGYFYYLHRANTAKRTPNLPITAIRASEDHIGFSYTAAQLPYVSYAEDTYFEVFGGYPRNHYTHKRMQFSPVKFKSLSGKYRFQMAQAYTRGSQTVTTTIDEQSGLEDASLPVQSIQTSNVNLVKSDNVINQ